MRTSAVTVFIDREQRSITPGALRGQDIIKFATATPGKSVVFEASHGIKVPVAPTDLIHIRGNEQFSTSESGPPEGHTPTAAMPVAVTINDQPLPDHTRPSRIKATGSEIKALAGKHGMDLWFEVDGIGDVLIEDSDNVIIQQQDRFFTAPREHEDRFYEVTVILDGEDRFFRLPAGFSVRDAIRRCLPPRDRPQVNDFEMVDGNLGPQPLNPDQTLKAAGVRDGHVLSITKKNGGGG